MARPCPACGYCGDWAHVARAGRDALGQPVYFLTLAAELSEAAFGRPNPPVWPDVCPRVLSGDRLLVRAGAGRGCVSQLHQAGSTRVRIRISAAWRKLRLPPLPRFRAMPYQLNPLGARGLIVDLSSLRGSA